MVSLPYSAEGQLVFSGGRVEVFEGNFFMGKMFHGWSKEVVKTNIAASQKNACCAAVLWPLVKHLV